jgi:hypothetical protein
MKNFGIYQTFIDKSFNKRALLVGFIKSKDKSRAVLDYTDDDFKRGFLLAEECSNDDYNRPDLLKAIEVNKNELAMWA